MGRERLGGAHRPLTTAHGRFNPSTSIFEFNGGVLARFTAEQAQAVVEIQQLINDWGYDLDLHNGEHIAELVTEDCSYLVGGAPREGRAAVVQFYIDRKARLAATAEGVPTHRHALANLRVSFAAASEASITFNLIYFSTMGVAAGVEHADPASYADVRMNCRRDADGHWRIARFDSNQAFRRVLK
jgi:ketosteroid isomerase-like protein